MTFSLKDENLRFALLKAISDAAADEMARRRGDHLKPLLERHTAEGTKSYAVKLPGGDLVATVTLSVPKDTLDIVDDEKFIAWLEANHPDAVDVVEVPAEPEHTVVVPATRARTERTPVPKKVNAVLKAIKTVDGKLVDTSTGVEVEGLVKTPGGTPKSFAVTYEGEGRELLAGAYRAGKLDAIVAGTTLPPIGSTEQVVERRLESVKLESVTVDGRPHITVPPTSVVDVLVVPGDLAAETDLPGDVAAELAPIDDRGHARDETHHFPPTGAPHPLVDCGESCPTLAPWPLNDPLPEDVDPEQLGPEYSDGYQLAGERTQFVDAHDPWIDRPWAAPAPDSPATGDEFDPGQWGAPTPDPGSGW